MARKLRIAASVLFCVLSVLLVVLWARSYWRNDRILIPLTSGSPLGVELVCGRAVFSSIPELPNEFHWRVIEIDEHFGNGNPISNPALKWHRIDESVGLTLPYRFLFAVSAILTIVTAFELPDALNAWKCTGIRVTVAAAFIMIAWMAS